jgi:hypothetical protein
MESTAGFVQPDYLASIQLIFRLNYRQLALFFSAAQLRCASSHPGSLAAAKGGIKAQLRHSGSGQRVSDPTVCRGTFNC